MTLVRIKYWGGKFVNPKIGCFRQEKRDRNNAVYKVGGEVLGLCLMYTGGKTLHNLSIRTSKCTGKVLNL